MVGLGRPWIVIVIHGTNVDSSCVLDVDSGRSCRSQRHLFGWFCRSRYILTNHICGRIGIVTVFVENETHSDLVRLVGKILSCRHTSCKRTLRIRDHLPNVPFDHKHDIRFLLSILSVVVDGPPMTDVTGELDVCPCPCRWLYLYLYLSLSPFRRKGKLVHSLSHPIQLPQSKTVTSSRATHEENMSCSSSSS